MKWISNKRHTELQLAELKLKMAEQETPKNDTEYQFRSIWPTVIIAIGIYLVIKYVLNDQEDEHRIRIRS